MLDHRNENVAGISSPIGGSDRNTRARQQEIDRQTKARGRFDTHSYHTALKNAMREAPDVIKDRRKLGDTETMEAAYPVFRTGHFSLATLHSREQQR
jgi:twitching motility protein PilU